MKQIAQRKSDRRSVAHRRSPKAERERAKSIGGEVVRGSGSGKWEKADVRVRGVMRLEHKTTTKNSFSVTREMISKIEAAAMSGGEMPVIEIEFIDANGRKLSSVCVVPVYVLEMIGAYDKA
jgi:Holliday junction resolvase